MLCQRVRKKVSMRDIDGDDSKKVMRCVFHAKKLAHAFLALLVTMPKCDTPGVSILLSLDQIRGRIFRSVSQIFRFFPCAPKNPATTVYDDVLRARRIRKRETPPRHAVAFPTQHPPNHKDRRPRENESSRRFLVEG